MKMIKNLHIVGGYMIGRKYSKSLITRLENLEAKKPGNLLFEVTLDDGSTKRVNFNELVAMRRKPFFDGKFYSTCLPEWRIVEGSNLKELDELLDLIP